MIKPLVLKITKKCKTTVYKLYLENNLIFESVNLHEFLAVAETKIDAGYYISFRPTHQKETINK